MHYFFTYLINPIMRIILRSPFHGLVSDHLLLITFRGRKSGKQYTTPVGYDREGDRLTIFSDSSWWKNLRGGAPVTVRLKGQTRPGYAEATDDPEAVARAIRADLEEHGVGYARRRHRLSLDTDEVPGVAEIVEAARGKALIRIELNGRH
jgi:deazaflavin-dependent oxidoreductase (nitroreductase family)